PRTTSTCTGPPPRPTRPPGSPAPRGRSWPSGPAGWPTSTTTHPPRTPSRPADPPSARGTHRRTRGHLPSMSAPRTRRNLGPSGSSGAGCEVLGEPHTPAASDASPRPAYRRAAGTRPTPTPAPAPAPAPAPIAWSEPRVATADQPGCLPARLLAGSVRQGPPAAAG